MSAGIAGELFYKPLAIQPPLTSPAWVRGSIAELSAGWRADPQAAPLITISDDA